MTDISKVRDLLMPGLWAMAGDRGYKSTDLSINGDGGIDLKVFNETKHPLLSKEEIADGSFKGLFAPRLDKLLK